MPLISQAVWKNQSGTPIKERVKLKVDIVQGMTCAWAETPDMSKGFKHPDPVVSKQAKYSHEIVVDLSKIAGMPHQTGTVL